MNSMKASFAGGVIHSTDYFSSRDLDEGRAWLVLSLCDWHVLLPRPDMETLRQKLNELILNGRR